MRYIAGIDIGNSSTEVALATLDEAGALTITHSALAETSGIKGTLRNVFGIQEALALVRERGLAMAEASAARPTSMTAVIGGVYVQGRHAQHLHFVAIHSVRDGPRWCVIHADHRMAARLHHAKQTLF